mgnify:CR=1 FL=1
MSAPASFGETTLALEQEAVRPDDRSAHGGAIPDARAFSFASPNSGTAAADERAAAIRLSSYVPSNQPQLAFVNGAALGAMATLDRVASVASYTGTVTYPNNGFSVALRTAAGAMVRGTGIPSTPIRAGRLSS